MKILEWNIKGGSAFWWDKSIESIKIELCKYLPDVDILVLTEFVVISGVDKLFEMLNEHKYVFLTSSCSGKNGILIAIKKSLIDYDKFEESVKSVYKNETNLIYSHTEGCNILKVEFPLNDGSNLVVIGCRMETGRYKDLRKQYDFERACFDKILIPVVKPSKKDCKYIVCGDFNNARCMGNLNLKYNSKDYIKTYDNSQYAQYNYNLNIIKDTFEKNGYKMVDKTTAGKPIPTHKGFFPDDHIFVKGFPFIVKCEPVSTDKSDHYILLAEV